MNRAEGGRSRGYTIVETLIFLAVSGAMFVTAMALINGRQATTEFSNGVRDFESALNDIASDVSNGYYANGQTINCSYQTGRLVVTAGSDRQGANKGCIFVGKTVQLAPKNDGAGSYAVISLAGLQFVDDDFTKGNIDKIADAKLRPLTKTNDTDLTPQLAQTVRLGGGITFGCAFYATGKPTIAAQPCSSSTTGVRRTDIVSFISTFQPTDFKGNGGGSNVLNLYVPKAERSLDQPQTEAAAAVSGFTDGPSGNAEVNPGGGVFVCLQSNGTKQHALIKLGGEGSRFSSLATINDGGCGA